MNGKDAVSYIDSFQWQAHAPGLERIRALLGQLGDLSFSCVKRQYGIKDYGHLFREHGGVLDRFDSVTFCAPLTYLLRMIVPFWEYNTL